MLIGARVRAALESNRDAFQRSAMESAASRQRYARAFAEAAHLTAGEIEDRLGGVPWPGARPSAEWNGNGAIARFDQELKTAREAREWAMARLSGVTTVAVDGSQIAASKEAGVPVSLVQVAWFENPHHPALRYVKDIRNELLTPDEPPEDHGDPDIFADSRLFQRRFALELECAVACVQRLAPTPSPVVFVDGTFVLSFTSRMVAAAREAYFTALFELLDAAARHRIPVVGYIDTSYATDLVTMLRHSFDLPPPLTSDASLLASLMLPFDRTIALQCARGDVLPRYRTEAHDYSQDLFFVYLQVGAGRLPARVDFPRWVLDDGLLDHVLDIIRAEVVVGSGYPYALEAVDATAVLTMDDRANFYRLYHEFAGAAGLASAVPGKTLSKSRRR
ncbi:MAG TPA: DNA double-strand break repair nuclease NurA [Chloroflexota bacterium]|nr:DNA double-strand break repair nuclease NurA [Chloroflexota bacterium]